MICGLEVGLAIFGILALVRGKMTLSKNKVVVGVPARLLGLVALTPLPLAFMIGLVIGIMNAGADPEKFAKDNQGLLIGIEAGAVILIAIFVFAVGALIAISPAEAARRERANRYSDEDDYDDRRDRRDDRDDREWDDRDDDRRDNRDERDERDRKPWNR